MPLARQELDECGRKRKWCIDRNCDAERREAMLGPPTGHIFTAFATTPIDGGVARPSRFAVWRKFLPRLFKDYMTGDHRRSPLFDPRTFAPIAVPRRLTRTEEEQLGRST